MGINKDITMLDPLSTCKIFSVQKTRPLGWVALLLAGLLLSGCGGEAEATPVPTAELAPAAAAPTNIPAATAPLSILATEPATTPAAAPAPTAAPVMTATVTSNGVTAVITPLEVEEEADCPIESSLDLLGYPNLQEVMGCPTEEANFDAIAINEFGDAQPTDRFMLWFSRDNQIYVLFPDGTFSSYEDTFNEATDPTYPCNPLGGEEDSPPLPRRGFGKLWCSDPILQQVMGPVPREERLCQHSVQQRFASGRLLACFEDATIRYFRLLDNGTWDIQTQ
jgi:hypothetical protein